MAYLYKLTPSKKGSDYMIPVNTTYTEEYADSICDFYLIDERNDTYRLHSGKPKRLTDCLPLSIKCPKCNGNLTPIDGPINSNILLLYECRHCKKN